MDIFFHPFPLLAFILPEHVLIFTLDKKNQNGKLNDHGRVKYGKSGERERAFSPRISRTSLPLPYRPCFPCLIEVGPRNNQKYLSENLFYGMEIEEKYQEDTKKGSMKTVQMEATAST